jgi:hypothetical protein
VHFGGVHGFGANETTDVLFSLGKGEMKLKIVIGAFHTDAEIGITRFLGPVIEMRTRKTDGSNRDNKKIPTNTTMGF